MIPLNLTAAFHGNLAFYDSLAAIAIPTATATMPITTGLDASMAGPCLIRLTIIAVFIMIHFWS